MTSVYFATNRALTGSPSLWTSYGPNMMPGADPAGMVYAVATVEGTDLTRENSGNITAITGVQNGSFTDAIKAEILSARRNILIFLHGFGNAFRDGITRAAFNREWFASSGLKGADTTVVAFTWPSLGQVVAAPPHLLPDDYLRDQGNAQSSGPHIAAFFRQLQTMLMQAQSAGQRSFLLAHSMGNYALQAAVQSWFTHGEAAQLLFNETFLAAADERDDSFAFPRPGRLSSLPLLTEHTWIYYSVRDVAMYLSAAVNLIGRIGFDGPDDKSNQSKFPPTQFRMLDCADVGDYNLAVPPDASHQYYRRSRKVRDHIASVMNGSPPPGLS
ncbi:MAG: alpha/beta hydrolase [Acetobacteraceae bacterium]|nr:alpha/beta hydrolase [Acetobacteraceae bacterium]